jgi:hypothetical protein
MFSFASARLRIALSLLIALPLLDAGHVRSAENSSDSQESATATTKADADSSNAASPGAIGSANSAAPDGSTIVSDQEMGHDGQLLTPDLASLGAKIRRTLALYEPKHLNARDNTCWEVMHNLIAFGPRTEIFRDGPGGVTVNAMGWLCWGARCQGEPLIVLENGLPHGLYGVGLEGHDGQYLAMLAQWRVRPTSPMRIGGKDFTVADLIEDEKLGCQSGTELTFKLIALAHYLPSDAKWTSRYGEDWTIPKLLKAEIESPINGATCGGSHRLFGIANAVKERAKRDEPINGEWARAAKYISDYQRYTLGNLQNPDGSFSTEWFNYPADRQGDVDRKLQTTGHMLEFIVWSLPTDQLRDPRVVKAVDFLSDALLANPDKKWSIGPLGHALHSLVIYHERMFTEPALPPVSQTAGEPVKTKPRSISALTPPNPVLESNGNSTISQLQHAAEKPKQANPVDGAAKSGAAAAKDIVMKDATGNGTAVEASTAKSLSAKEIADRSDGCTDSIPAAAARESGLRLALRDIISVIAPQAIAPTPVAPPSANSGPTLPSDAPFDRPAAGPSGP